MEILRPTWRNNQKQKDQKDQKERPKGFKRMQRYAKGFTLTLRTVEESSTAGASAWHAWHIPVAESSVDSGLLGVLVEQIPEANENAKDKRMNENAVR